jgi:hypothetical protein
METIKQVLWVLVDTGGSETTYRVFENKPGSPAYMEREKARPTPIDPIFRSYREIVEYLRSLGFTPPPSQYFHQTDEEVRDGKVEFVRKVTKAGIE